MIRELQYKNLKEFTKTWMILKEILIWSKKNQSNLKNWKMEMIKLSKANNTLIHIRLRKIMSSIKIQRKANSNFWNENLKNRNLTNWTGKMLKNELIAGMKMILRSSLVLTHIDLRIQKSKKEPECNEDTKLEMMKT